MIDPTKLTDAMTDSGGRWRVTPDLYHNGPSYAVVDEAGLLVLDGRSRDEAHAVVRVHNAVPDLLDEIKRLQYGLATSGSAEATVERVRALHTTDGPTCLACGGWTPCATLRALDADA